MSDLYSDPLSFLPPEEAAELESLVFFDAPTFSGDVGDSENRRARGGSSSSFSSNPRKDALALDEDDARMPEGFAGRMKAIEDYDAVCALLESRIKKAVDVLESLQCQHQLVSEKTNALHETCTSLLQQQKQLDNVVRDMKKPLQVFEEVSRLGSLFGLSLQEEAHHQPLHRRVSPESSAFRDALARVDECVAYMESCPQFLAYAEYSRKFRQLRHRGLTLVRNFIVDCIGKTSSAAEAALRTKVEKKQSIVNEENMLMVRFQALASQLRSSIGELEIRTKSNASATSPASNLLRDCQLLYSAKRSQLISITLNKSTLASELQSEGATLVHLVRAGCAHLADVCSREYKLFRSFFPVDVREPEEVKLRGGGAPDAAEAGILPTKKPVRGVFHCVLDAACDDLYDILRPRIVTFSDMDGICEAVRVVQSEIIDGELTPKGDAVAPLSSMLFAVLTDMQERLVYCTHQYIRDHIGGYAADPSELDYPKVLAETIKDDADALNAGLYNGWFITLERTLLCLSKIYRCLTKPVFAGLAQDAVNACTQSLFSSARAISESATEFDGELFLVKHLLILREQISPFNVELSSKEKLLDFTSTAHALNHFVSSRRTLFRFDSTNALLELWKRGVPTIQEHESDAKKRLEDGLRDSCESFIKRSTARILGPILPLLEKITAFTASVRSKQDAAAPDASSEVPSLQSQAFSQEEALSEMLSSHGERISDEIAFVRTKLQVYLTTEVTRSILFKPIKINVFAVLTQLRHCVETNYPQESAKRVVPLIDALRGSVSMSDEA